MTRVRRLEVDGREIAILMADLADGDPWTLSVLSDNDLPDEHADDDGHRVAVTLGDGQTHEGFAIMESRISSGPSGASMVLLFTGLGELVRRG